MGKALELVARIGDLARVKELSQGASGSDKKEALKQAGQRGYLEVVRYLIKHRRVNVNTREEDGETILMWAVNEGNCELVHFLVEVCDADVNAKKRNGWTALMMAVSKGNMEIAQCLVEKCSADVNAKKDDGETAVMRAVKEGKVELVRFLVKKCGADVNAKKNDGETAVMRAVNNCNVELVHFLVKNCGADVNAKKRNGWTALRMAVSNGKMEIVQCLVKKCGVDVDAKAKDGETAVMWAVMKRNIKLVRYLFEECGADVNAKKLNGDTALIKAVRFGNIELVRYLVVECSADVNASNNRRISAVRIAADCGHQEIQRILTPYLQPAQQSPAVRTTNNAGDTATGSAKDKASWVIAPAELELTHFAHNGHIGGDFHAKWLDSDVGVKLYIADAAPSPFEDEVHLWQQLRHPNVVKMYGACKAGQTLKLFVCEYASKGSLHELVKVASAEKPATWKYLYNAALGLEYLHERRIVHGDLRCSNILIGDDGLAKLSIFGRSGVYKRLNEHSVVNFGSKHWDAPEVFQGGLPSYESDVYSLGMCIVEAATGSTPWNDKRGGWLKHYKLGWEPEVNVDKRSPGRISGDARELVRRMCCREPRKRASLPSIVSELERLATEESSNSDQPEHELAISFDEYRCGHLSELWMKLQTSMKTCDDAQLRHAFDDIKKVHDHLRDPVRDPKLLKQFLELLTEFYRMVKMSPEQARNLRLSSTRATTTSLKEIQWRINNLLASMGWARDTVLEKERELTPAWFIPRYQLVVDEWSRPLGTGGFGSVRRAKWLDSDVVVKQVTLPGSDGNVNTSTLSSLSASIQPNPTATQAQKNTAKRVEAVAMFRREVDIWFGFNHPHAVRLFGACHVGRPFFVCEFATNGTLVSYLQKHPDELWSKLHEAALGLQYLHARNVVHGDLKGNNIVIGSDLKAKVTDFGLSSFADDEAESKISAAWNWVAPECMLDASTGPTSASDVYSLGMCIVEALRVVGAVMSGNNTQLRYPWGDRTKTVVKHEATHGKLPSRPAICKDRQWELIKRMCVLDPEKRMKISTVVDELAKLSSNTTSNNQEDVLADAGAQSLCTNLVDLKAASDVISAARGLLNRLEGDANQDEVTSLYASLWDHFELVRGQIDREKLDVGCLAAFSSLIADANASTAELEKANTSLILQAQTTMRCYALRRRLDKLCDAYFIVCEAQDPGCN